MNEIEEYQNVTESKELPKEYLIYKLRIILNKELFESKKISYDIYNRMQKNLMKKMDDLWIKSKT